MRTLPRAGERLGRHTDAGGSHPLDRLRRYRWAKGFTPTADQFASSIGATASSVWKWTRYEQPMPAGVVLMAWRRYRSDWRVMGITLEKLLAANR